MLFIQQIDTKETAVTDFTWSLRRVTHKQRTLPSACGPAG